MGYYRRYSVLYYIAALCFAGIWLWASLGGGFGTFFAGLLLFFFAVCCTAFLCSFAAAKRFRAALLRMQQTADIAAYLRELNGCARSARANTYNTILFSQAYALQLAGDLAGTSQLLQRADLNRARSRQNRQNDRCAYSVRCAGLALQLGQMEAAAAHIDSLRKELLSLPSGHSLYSHYAKCLTDLDAMAAVLRGEGGQVHYFSNLLTISASLVERAQANYYLGLALLRENRVEEARSALSYPAQNTPTLLAGRRAAAMLQNPDALQEGRIDAFLFGEFK